MARVAEWRDDLGGIATGGTSTAYTVASNRVFASAAVMDKAIVCFVPHTTCGPDATLAVDGLTARQIRTATGENVLSGQLVAGTPYQVIYIHSSTEFILINSSPSRFSVPIGGIIPYVGQSAPNSNFVFPYGQAVSRTTYATLFALTSTAFGAGDGSTTFNLPDLRGRIIACMDNVGGAAASRLTSAAVSPNGTTI